MTISDDGPVIPFTIGGSGTTSCVDPNHFDATDGVVSPQPWMQWRQVRSAISASVSGSYPPNGGGAKNDLLQVIEARWTNNSPIAQQVYGLVTRGGAFLALQARSRAYLVMRHGLAQGSASPAVEEVSRFGGGIDIGTAGSKVPYAVAEQRQSSRTLPLMPHLTGWTELAPGASITGRVELRFVSDFWENLALESDEGSEASYITGDTRLDLFAVPVL
ncbi:minor tail protein [Gordonia phage Sour]|uniref:DUF7172 domain-containing protein n=1 Tax=Gordonia phage Sour TaxID=2182349 RepID=A0A2U8UKN8_9CAUD|nr:minor tail protein [Gordonia phage Sour]AWN04237.1 hypothetical protein PBI_SOUR_36 [Gordonia phage Sour]